jgi:multidrug resistance protein, MATE family
LTIAAEIRKFVDEFLLGYFRLFNYIHFKMKTLTFLFFGLLLCPMTLLAQSADVLLQKVADALSAGKDDYVWEMATLYFHICIWGAPAMLGLYGLSGWYIGMQNSRIPMYIAITQNIVNIMASLSLVCFFGMKVEGVALGTLIAQYAGFLMGLVLWMNRYGKLKKYIVWKGVLQKEAMIRFFQVNRDIFLRTLCLVAVTLFFTSAGASQGEIILAVNTLLMQLFTLFSYVMDGFAYAGEALSG